MKDKLNELKPLLAETMVRDQFRLKRDWGNLNRELKNGRTSAEQLEKLAHPLKNSPYGKYLMDIARNTGIDTSMIAQSRQ